MDKTSSRGNWRALLKSPGRRWWLLSIASCVWILLFRSFWPLLPLWGGHALLIGRDSDSRMVRYISYGIAALLAALFLLNLFWLISAFL